MLLIPEKSATLLSLVLTTGHCCGSGLVPSYLADINGRVETVTDIHDQVTAQDGEVSSQSVHLNL